MTQELNPNHLPSRFQIGAMVVLPKTATGEFPASKAEVIGVQFTPGKVHYLVEFEDTGREELVDSCDVEAA